MGGGHAWQDVLEQATKRSGYGTNHVGVVSTSPWYDCYDQFVSFVNFQGKRDLVLGDANGHSTLVDAWFHVSVLNLR